MVLDFEYIFDLTNVERRLSVNVKDEDIRRDSQSSGQSPSFRLREGSLRSLSQGRAVEGRMKIVNMTEIS